MATMFARHDVEDYETWKAAYDRFDDERRDMGVTGHGVYQADGDPNDVTVYHHFDTMEQARAFAGSERLRTIMKDAGVIGTPDVWLTEKV